MAQKIITQENLLKVLEQLLFITLCIASLLFTKEVYIQFNSGDTSFKQYESTISESPTITLCLNDKLSNYRYNYIYGIDFNISYYIDDDWVLLSLEDDTFNNDTEEIIQVSLDLGSPKTHKMFCRRQSQILDTFIPKIAH